MRILVVHHLLPLPPLDGGRLRRLQHLEALGAEHEITVVGRAPDRRAAEAFVRAHPDWRVEVVPEGDDPRRSLVVPWVRRLVAGTPFDCVHVAGVAQWPGERALGAAAVVLDVEHLDGTVFRRMRAAGAGTISDFDLAATDALTRAAVGRADLVLACSATDADQLRALVPDAPLAVVPNGVDTAWLAGVGPVRRSGRPTVTFTGLLAYAPNADACRWLVEQILPEVEARVGAVTFQMVGRVPPAGVVALADGDRVRLAADVPDVRPWLAAADAIVVPLRMGSGTRLKILEAFAAGRPVVSTSVGCEGLDVEPDRHLLVADTASAFAAATAAVLTGPVLAGALAREARSIVRERYDVRVVAETLRRLYRALGGSARRQAVRETVRP